jgi:hypothetical protein
VRTGVIVFLCAWDSSEFCGRWNPRSFLRALGSSKFCVRWARRSFVHTGCRQAQDMPMTGAREAQDKHRTGTAQAHITTHDVSLLFIVFALFSIVFLCIHNGQWFFYCSSLVFIVFVMFLLFFILYLLFYIVLHCL